VPNVDESSIDDVKVQGDSATATLADGRQVSLREQNGDWEPQQVERPEPDGAQHGDGQEGKPKSKTGTLREESRR
jgi:hypothetical protein